MSSRAFSLEGWIKEIGLTEADQKAVLDLIGKGGEKAARYIEGNQLRQDEFSRKMDALQADIKKKEDELKVKMDEENRFHSSLSTWREGNEKKVKDAIEARENAEHALQAARDKAKKLATDFGVPEDQINSLFEGVPVRVKNNDTHQGFDPKELDSKYVTRDVFQNEARAYAELIPIIDDIRYTHKELFNERLTRQQIKELISKTAASGGKSLEQVYNEEFKVAAKREELRNASHQADIEKARKEGEEAARAKILADNPTLSDRNRDRGDREGSPVLTLARKQAEEAAKKGAPPTAIQSPVAAAVAAFNSGKYKPGQAA